MNSDFKDLLKLLADYEVKYLVVGGYAVMHYAEPRYTKDLDIWIEANPENGERIFKALKEFGAPLTGLTSKDFSEPGYFYKMGNPPVRVDILMSIEGLSFQECYLRKKLVTVDTISLSFIALDDLVKSKELAGRDVDILDASNLRKLKKAK